jgi:hypothetical protein
MTAPARETVTRLRRKLVWKKRQRIQASARSSIATTTAAAASATVRVGIRKGRG